MLTQFHTCYLFSITLQSVWMLHPINNLFGCYTQSQYKVHTEYLMQIIDAQAFEPWVQIRVLAEEVLTFIQFFQGGAN